MTQYLFRIQLNAHNIPEERLWSIGLKEGRGVERKREGARTHVAPPAGTCTDSLAGASRDGLFHLLGCLLLCLLHNLLHLGTHNIHTSPNEH